MKMALGLVAALICGTALAHDSSNPAHSRWLMEQRNAAGLVCCDGDDVLSDKEIEWDASGGRYRVKVGEEWLDVPRWAMVLGPNKVGSMLVWLGTLEGKPFERCFMPGTLS